MPENLKEFVEQCEDAAVLHEIAKEKFGETIHNRTGLEKSRELVLAMIDKPEQPQIQSQTKRKILKNKRTGKVFLWTAKLAKNKNLVEV